MKNMPIYRAKKIDSDEYVKGTLTEIEELYCICNTKNIYPNSENTGAYCTDKRPWIHRNYFVPICIDTLAIHFPNMTDSQGNEIFASLSEDGKGGDMFMWDNEKFIVWFDGQTLKINATNKDNFESNCHDSLNEWYDFNNKCYDLKVSGIKE